MTDRENLVPIHEARRVVLESCPVLDPIPTELGDAVGCVCAQEVLAAEDVPPFANSAVDGYAVRSHDVRDARPDAPVRLDIVGEIAAGSHATMSVGPSQAVRIMTGAPVPEGADGIVMVEQTRLVGIDRSGVVEILQGVSAGSAVRAAGDDVRAGDRVFTAGVPISPVVAGVMASLGCRRPVVHPRPRVAVLSTGDELVDDGSPLGPGKIRESNRIMLLGLVDQAGAIGVDYGIVRDDEALLENVLGRAASECDAIVTSGGVSMGDYDVVKAVLGRVADMTWMQIAIKPAKPFAFGLLASTNGQRPGRSIPVFGLPGNPVSSMVSFELLARPALRKMAGYPSSQWDRPVIRSVADEPFRRSVDGKVHYQRAVAHFAPDGRLHVAPVSAQGSHQLAASASANALVVLPDGHGVDVRQDVDVVLLLS